MKRFLPLLLVFALLLPVFAAQADVFDTLNQMLDAPASSDTQTEPSASEGGDAGFTITQTVIGRTASKSYVSGNYMIEVVNNSDKPVSFNYQTISVTITDADGKVLVENDHVSVYPELLLPGETGFGSDYFSFSIGDEIASADAVLNFTPSIQEPLFEEDMKTRFEVSRTEITERTAFGGTYPGVLVEAVNNSGKDLYGVYVSYGIYDAEDKLLCTGVDSVGGNFVYKDGTAMVFDQTLTGDLAELWAKESVKPDHVKAIVFANLPE